MPRTRSGSATASARSRPASRPTCWSATCRTTGIWLIVSAALRSRTSSRRERSSHEGCLVKNEVLLDGASLTFAQVLAVAYGAPGQPRVALSEPARKAVQRAADGVQRLLKEGRIAY